MFKGVQIVHGVISVSNSLSVLVNDDTIMRRPFYIRLDIGSILLFCVLIRVLALHSLSIRQLAIGYLFYIPILLRVLFLDCSTHRGFLSHNVYSVSTLGVSWINVV